MIITGGVWSKTLVTQYWEDGSYEILPDLNNGRFSHGCSSYIDNDNNIVKAEYK